MRNAGWILANSSSPENKGSTWQPGLPTARRYRASASGSGGVGGIPRSGTPEFCTDKDANQVDVRLVVPCSRRSLLVSGRPHTIARCTPAQVHRRGGYAYLVHSWVNNSLPSSRNVPSAWLEKVESPHSMPGHATPEGECKDCCKAGFPRGHPRSSMPLPWSEQSSGDYEHRLPAGQESEAYGFAIFHKCFSPRKNTGPVHNGWRTEHGLTQVAAGDDLAVLVIRALHLGLISLTQYSGPPAVTSDALNDLQPQLARPPRRFSGRRRPEDALSEAVDARPESTTGLAVTGFSLACSQSSFGAALPCSSSARQALLAGDVEHVAGQYARTRSGATGGPGPTPPCPSPGPARRGASCPPGATPASAAPIGAQVGDQRCPVRLARPCSTLPAPATPRRGRIRLPLGERLVLVLDVDDDRAGDGQRRRRRARPSVAAGFSS